MKLITPFSGGRKTDAPELIIRTDIRTMLADKGWYALITHGTIYSSGLPDIYATHSRYGARWIEVKDPERTGDVFTAAQHDVFPKICANGSGVWVLVAATEEEYQKLFKKCNWYMYLSAWTRTKGL